MKVKWKDQDQGEELPPGDGGLGGFGDSGSRSDFHNS